jgi:hypothetical protein
MQIRNIASRPHALLFCCCSFIIISSLLLICCKLIISGLRSVSALSACLSSFSCFLSILQLPYYKHFSESVR